MAALNLSDDELKRYILFRPQTLRRYTGVLNAATPMVHYTTAEAAMSIITDRRIWLRNSAFMNDASEIKYGMDLLSAYFHSDNPARAAFWQAVDRHTNGRAKELQKLYDDWRFDLSSSTFICCVSEHDLSREHEFGRLSMWRAYGRTNGVGLIVNSAYLALEAQGLAAYSYPIEYWTREQAFERFAELESNFLQATQYLNTLSADDIYSEMFNALQTFSLTIKHPGFAEEREWRVIHRPNAEASDLITAKTVSINGAPQKVFLLPLEAAPDRDLALDLNTLVNRVIIGPSTHAGAMWRAFVDALDDAGVVDAQQKVVCSQLPLRTG